MGTSNPETDSSKPPSKFNRRDFLTLMTQGAKVGTIGAFLNRIPMSERSDADFHGQILEDFNVRFNPRYTNAFGKTAEILEPAKYFYKVDGSTPPEEEIGKPLEVPIDWLKSEKMAALGNDLALLQTQIPHIPRVVYPVLTYGGSHDANLANISQTAFTEYPDFIIIPATTSKLSVFAFPTAEIIEEIGLKVKISWIAVSSLYASQPLSDKSQFQIIDWKYKREPGKGAGGGAQLISPSRTIFIARDFEILDKRQNHPPLHTNQG